MSIRAAGILTLTCYHPVLSISLYIEYILIHLGAGATVPVSLVDMGQFDGEA